MKILAVCGFGVGSSMVLKMTIEKVARNLELDADVENTDISSAKSMHADVIFTSAEFAEELSKDTNTKIYSIKKYMDKEEVEKALNDFINNK